MCSGLYRASPLDLALPTTSATKHEPLELKPQAFTVVKSTSTTLVRGLDFLDSDTTDPRPCKLSPQRRAFVLSLEEAGRVVFIVLSDALQ